MAFCEPKRARELSCATCPTAVKNLRKCSTAKEDYDENDAAFWPMRVVEGGTLYGFCPGKATWDAQANHIFRMLVVSAECGAMYQAGGLNEQPTWYFELVSNFIPRYHDLKFQARAKMILGDGKNSGVKNHGSHARSTSR